MSNFQQAIGITLKNENGFSHDRDTGEVVNFGITHWFLRAIGVFPKQAHDTPATGEEISFIHGMTVEYATELYHRYFWDATNVRLIQDQELAAKVFDLSVNTGSVPVIRLLQLAVNELRAAHLLTPDGLIGPKTAAAVNTTEPEALLDRLRSLCEIRYRAIAKQNPKLAKNLAGWLDRLHA